MTRNVLLATSLPCESGQLYDMYLDPLQHAAMTGQEEVKIAPEAGAPFSAFGGMLSGTILHTEPKRLIMQTWRSGNWPAGSIDSVLVLVFLQEGDGGAQGRIELSHMNVPDEDFAGICQGWEKYYWAPWRAYLESGRAIAE